MLSRGASMLMCRKTCLAISCSRETSCVCVCVCQEPQTLLEAAKAGDIEAVRKLLNEV